MTGGQYQYRLGQRGDMLLTAMVDYHDSKEKKRWILGEEVHECHGIRDEEEEAEEDAVS